MPRGRVSVLVTQKKLETYYKRFKDHVQPKLNPIFARYKFNNEVQNQDTIDAFVTRLCLSARDCSFDKADEMIRDRIVFGTSSPQIRAKLINVGAELTLETRAVNFQIDLRGGQWKTI